MLRRLLSLLLILSIFGYGLALAVDLHGNSPEDPVAAMHPLADSASHQQGMDDGDHCSHGAVHLLGMERRLALDLASAADTHAGCYRDDSTSFSPAPFLRPPIAV